jgi:hypothetical protein
MVVPSQHEYTDFDLSVEKIEGHPKYQVRVLRSPGGEGKGEFALPFDFQELENFFLKIGHRRDDLRSAQPPQIEAAEKFGAKLFDAVFSDEISSVLATSLAASAGLRIRLRMNNAPELAQLPWEFLFYKPSSQFLALERNTPIVRYLELKHAAKSLGVTPPIRILVVIANPMGSRKLNTSDERRRLKSALLDLRNEGKIVLKFISKPTLEGLQKELQKKHFHILHFIGHGDFNSSTGEGVLLFEDDQRRSVEVNGEDLGVLLHNHNSLRLAVINACEGGRSARDDAFAGVGQTLIKRGLPAVIAMQFPISDLAARVFADSFYTAMANGYPVDAALVESRTALYTQRKQLGVEWGTPVLYMRSSDGRLFDLEASSEPTSRFAKLLKLLSTSLRSFTRVLEIVGISVVWLLVFASISIGIAEVPKQSPSPWVSLFSGWQATYLITAFLSTAGYLIIDRYLASSARTLLKTILGVILFGSCASYSESNFRSVGIHLWSGERLNTIQFQVVSVSTGEPISEARLRFFVNGHLVDDVNVNSSGQFTYAVHDRLAEISVKVGAPHFQEKLLDGIARQGPKQVIDLVPDQNSQPEREPFISTIPFTGFPVSVSQNYTYGFSSIQYGAVWGEGVQIQRVTVDVEFTASWPLASFDTWVLLGPKPFGYKPGQHDGDWSNGIAGQWGAGALNMKLTYDVAPAQYRFVLGTGKKDPFDPLPPHGPLLQQFVASYKFGDQLPSGDVLQMREVFGTSIDLPHGLYAQLYFWTSTDSHVQILSAVLTVEGLKPKNAN